MGNEDKIKDIVEVTKSEFLKGELIEKRSKPKIYSLHDEFAKTKKNKSIGVYLVILGFVGLIVVGAVVITGYIQKRSRSVGINIGEFEDINLAELLDNAKKNENKLKQLTDEVNALRIEMRNRIMAIRDLYAKKRELILAKMVDSKKRKQMIIENKSKEKRIITYIVKTYKKKIRQKEEEIARIRIEIQKYDKRLMESAKKSEAIINNYRKIHEIEMEKQKEKYEKIIRAMRYRYRREINTLKTLHKRIIKELILKYNPIFKDRYIINILRAYAKQSVPAIAPFVYKGVMGREWIIDKSHVKILNKNITDVNELIAKLIAIPFTNSVDDTIHTINVVFANIINKYNSIVSMAANRLNVKNSILSGYMWALSRLTDRSREHGYIVDPRDKEAMIVYINKNYDIGDGRDALVLKEDNTKIARIRLFKTRDGIRAKVVKLFTGDGIGAFDKILIIYKEGSR